MRPVQGEPIECFGGPLDGVVVRGRPPLVTSFDHGPHRYQLKRDLTGWRYLYRGTAP
jgi:hypothetical protein